MGPPLYTAIPKTNNTINIECRLWKFIFRYCICLFIKYKFILIFNWSWNLIRFFNSFKFPINFCVFATFTQETLVVFFQVTCSNTILNSKNVTTQKLKLWSFNLIKLQNLSQKTPSNRKLPHRRMRQYDILSLGRV